MQRYNYDLDLSTLNSNSMIISHINKNTKVLEFGPAFGRLTKYLSEKYGCVVDIVEIDDESGSVAKQFARNSCIGLSDGNVETLYWAELLEGNKYDYIIFADVLEHLRNPEVVLNKCREFLNDDGRILCSVPNIAHSSVLISLWNDDFNYTDVGLLDNTHVHFFTKSTFQKMAKNSGYSIVSIEEIVSEVAANEIPYTYDMIPVEVEHELHFRKEGEVYQYIFELAKIEQVLENTTCNYGRNCGYEITCFFKQKDDNDFSDTKFIKKKFLNKRANISLDFSQINDVNGLCITLFEKSVLIKIHNVMVNDAVVEYESAGVRIDENLYYFENAAQIFISYENIKSVQIDFEILKLGSVEVSLLAKELTRKYTELLDFKRELCDIQKNNEMLKALVSQLEAEKAVLEDAYRSVNNEKEELESLVNRIIGKLGL